MWEQLKRVIKPNGAIVMTAAQPFTTKLISSNYEMFKYCWYWDKVQSSGFAHAKNMPLKNVEDVIVFSSGAVNHASLSGENRMSYYPQGVEKLDKLKTKSNERPKNRVTSFSKRPSLKPTYKQEFTNYPKQLITFSNCNTDKKGSHHPTQKPVALMEYLIRTYTQKGETVLDFAFGSGTTGVAAKALQRRFIGVELDAKYFEIASERISKAQVYLI